MKYKDISSLTLEEIDEQLEKTREELRHLRFIHAVSSVENSTSLKDNRRLIAQLKTLKNTLSKSVNN